MLKKAWLVYPYPCDGDDEDYGPDIVFTEPCYGWKIVEIVYAELEGDASTCNS